MNRLLITRVVDGVICYQDGRPLSAEDAQYMVDLANERARQEKMAVIESQARHAKDLGPLVSAVWDAERQDFAWAWANGGLRLEDEVKAMLQRWVMANRVAPVVSPFVIGGSTP